jgi:hypothetical protein
MACPVPPTPEVALRLSLMMGIGDKPADEITGLELTALKGGIVIVKATVLNRKVSATGAYRGRILRADQQPVREVIPKHAVAY